ncbi:MAG: hypothetical protein FJZ09_03210 [Candidatus Omnitrophica bacterium]|nr:hypothetical protein [Candidatus Omnitrophota bacterium]
MSALGIYFGPKIISIVESKGKKLLNHAQIQQATVSRGELEEKVPQEVKTIEIIALFKDELRRSRIEAKEATLGLSGKDLIIRTFEIPQLPKEELASAVIFEAKKYIPFRVEDLISDFQLIQDKESRTNQVIFMGIKKETLDTYFAILNQLDIKISAIEYSAFSLSRYLALSGVGEKGVVAILGADLKGEDEVNFTVFENGFPLFSRDIALTSGPAEEFGGPAEAADLLGKLKTEIRVSLDYFRRKFPNKNVRKTLLLTGPDVRSELESMLAEMGLSVTYADLEKIVERTAPYSLSFAKGYSASLTKAIKSAVKVNLVAARAKIKPEAKEKRIAIEAAPLLKGLKIDVKMVILGIAICAGAFAYGRYQMEPLNKELAGIRRNRPEVAGISPDATIEQLEGKETDFKRRADSLDNLIKKQVYLTQILDALPRLTPKEMWLTRLTYSARKERGRSDLAIEGMVYMGDADKEFEAVNRFLDRVKKNPDFTKYFRDISIVSIDRRQSERVTGTNFAISCKAF